jgi:hypothetical protein
MRMSGRLRRVAAGVLRRVETEVPAGATLESELLCADDGSFREHGSLSFDSGSTLSFRTLGAGRLSPTVDPHTSHGTVTWEVDAGTGRFEGAAGRISSNFTVGEHGQVEDEQVGVLFLPEPPNQEGATQ